ncbi:MAG: hypothetical protein LBV12_06965 [Puniceicoccales bacterium]|jgi:hypothetical protein|nr:hypothetical protein [Puniceicoccales bacterium]
MALGKPPDILSNSPAITVIAKMIPGDTSPSPGTKEVLFFERQTYLQNPFCIWPLVGLAGLGIILGGLFLLLGNGSNLGTMVFFTLSGAALLALAILLMICLETRIQRDGVYYRLFPLNLIGKKKSWEEIENAYTCQYRPLIDFGGWGIRVNFFGKGWAWNVSGNKGLQLILTNGKRILIGTQKPEEIDRVLRQLEKLPPPENLQLNPEP